MQADSITWHSHARVEKYTDEQVAWVRERTGVDNPSADLLAAHLAPEEVTEQDGNLLTTAGLTRLTSLLTGGGGQALTNTSARLGVGDGSGTAAVGDTDLSASAGASHRYFQVMDATYPQVSGGVITCKATYDSSTANFTWAEWGIDIGTPTVSAGTTVNAVLLNHKTGANLGTKTSGSYGFTVTVQIS